MSVEMLRRAAEVEREEWGGATNARMYPNGSALHLALANWLDAIAQHWEGVEEQAEDPDDPVDADGQRIGYNLDDHALIVARRILGEDT